MPRADSRGGKTLHIAPGDSAGGSLLQAIRDDGRDEAVLSWLDDLSCGPIESDDPSERAAWWASFHDDRDIEGQIRAFWSHVATTNERLVVWFGRHSAQELSFVLAWAERLGERAYDIIDVTGLQMPFIRPDGSAALSYPKQAVSLVSVDGLKSLLGSERPITNREREGSRRSWLKLKQENALFRIVTSAGLVSAPEDIFDSLLIERVTPEWQRVIFVVGNAMGYNSEPYMQVGDVMLLMRVVALIRQGKLLADGDPWDMRTCRVRLPT